MKLLALPCYCATLRQLSRAVTSIYEEAFAGSGLHSTQYTLLQVLDSIPEISTTELADLMGIDQTTATRMLALLAKGRFIESVTAEDARRRPWILTASGRKTLQKLKPNWDAAQTMCETRLGLDAAQALKKAAYAGASRLIEA